MRILRQPLLRHRNSDHFKHISRFVSRILTFQVQMSGKRLRKLLCNSKYGIQTRHRILKNHANLIAVQLPHLCIGILGNFLPVKANRFRGHTCIVVQKMHDRQHCNALSAAAFSHNSHAFLFTNPEGNVTNRLNLPRLCLKGCF